MMYYARAHLIVDRGKKVVLVGYSSKSCLRTVFVNRTTNVGTMVYRKIPMCI
jgi:hypothetical protein